MRRRTGEKYLADWHHVTPLDQMRDSLTPRLRIHTAVVAAHHPQRLLSHPVYLTCHSSDRLQEPYPPWYEALHRWRHRQCHPHAACHDYRERLLAPQPAWGTSREVDHQPRGATDQCHKDT